MAIDKTFNNNSRIASNTMSKKSEKASIVLSSNSKKVHKKDSISPSRSTFNKKKALVD